jgi:ferredoxin
MANLSDRLDDNAPGSFYVDSDCIDCDLCRQRVPDVFARSDEGGHSYVTRQPTSEEERAKCLEALEDCPAEAIGDDGEEQTATAA